MKLDIREEKYKVKNPRIKQQSPTVRVLTLEIKKEITTTRFFAR